MPFGQTITSFIADLYPVDPAAPQIVGDFAQALPPNPIKGDAVSEYARSFPGDPYSPTDPYGPQISAFIHLLGPDTGTNSDTF